MGAEPVNDLWKGTTPKSDSEALSQISANITNASRVKNITGQDHYPA